MFAFSEEPLPVFVLSENTSGSTLNTTASIATRTGCKWIRVVEQVDLITFTFPWCCLTVHLATRTVAPVSKLTSTTIFARKQTPPLNFRIPVKRNEFTSLNGMEKTIVNGTRKSLQRYVRTRQTRKT